MNPFSDEQLIHEAQHCVAEIRERAQVGRTRLETGMAECLVAVSHLLDAAEQAGANATSREETALEDTLARHDVLLDDFVQAVADTTESQVVLERRAHAHTSEVRTISRAMARAASSSRLVAINALINANALESGQATLAALAQEMQQLSGVVQQSSSDVDAIANRLGAILPALNECVSKIAAATEQFATEVGTERALVRISVGDLQRSLSQPSANTVDIDARGTELRDALAFGAEVNACLDVLESCATAIEHQVDLADQVRLVAS